MISAFFFAAVFTSFDFDVLADEAAFLGTSFYFTTFFDVETFFTTVTFSVFLAETYGFFTGAGFFYDLTADALTVETFLEGLV